jgi:hypothetical protein
MKGGEMEGKPGTQSPARRPSGSETQRTTEFLKDISGCLETMVIGGTTGGTSISEGHLKVQDIGDSQKGTGKELRQLVWERRKIKKISGFSGLLTGVLLSSPRFF